MAAKGASGNRSRKKDKEGKVKQEFFDEDEYSVDTADPVREYFGIQPDDISQKLLFVSVEKVKRDVYVDKMYLATSTTAFLLRKNDFKISATANGNIYVCTATEGDAKVLDGQVFTAFSGFVRFKAQDNVEPEFSNVYKPEEAAFKLFTSNVHLGISALMFARVLAAPDTPGWELDDGPPRDKWKLIKLIMMVASGSIASTLALLLCLGVSCAYFLQGRKRRTKSIGSLSFFRGEAVEIVELEQGTGPKRFSYDELATATGNFSDNRKLGEGGFGSVYQGFLEELNLPVAVKRVSKNSRQDWKEFMSEVKIISRLRHRNLVVLIGWCYDGVGDNLLLVYELMHNGSVDSHLYQLDPKKQLAWSTRYKIVLGLGSALVYLHHDTEQSVLHRDIKPSNVMRDASFGAKLGDFGLARVIDDDARRSRTTTPSGTTGYMDPECIATGRTSVESDVYSFGVVLLEIACGRCPVVTLQNGSTVHLVQRVWELYGAGRLLDAADARLARDYDVQEMERVMTVGLWYTRTGASGRPFGTPSTCYGFTRHCRASQRLCLQSPRTWRCRLVHH
ncbi:hypothetical protein EJB05_00451, partial [Eragrostis curvula]